MLTLEDFKKTFVIFKMVSFSFRQLMFNIAIAKKGNRNQISNSLLQEIVVVVLKEAAIEDLVLNQRILFCFHTKLQSLLLKGLKAKKSGGRQYRAFLECLNHSEPYRFKIYISETCKITCRD